MNLLYAQSGGVTAVINATAAGVIGAARQHPEQIGRPFARGTISTWMTAGIPSTSRISARW